MIDSFGKKKNAEPQISTRSPKYHIAFQGPNVGVRLTILGVAHYTHLMFILEELRSPKKPSPPQPAEPDFRIGLELLFRILSHYRPQHKLPNPRGWKPTGKIPPTSTGNLTQPALPKVLGDSALCLGR